MSAKSSTAETEWKNWLLWALGIWLCLSPWLLDPSASPKTMENGFFAGYLLAVVAGVALTAFRIWEEWIAALVGLWLLVCPWVLNLKSFASAADFIVIGAVVVALAVDQIRGSRTRQGYKC
jgi:hypothetical protein